MRERLAPALEARVGAALAAERALLAVLDASCRTPVAGLARDDGDRLHLRAAAYRPDGSQMWEMEGAGAGDEAEAIGTRVGRALLAQLPPDFFVAPPRA
jgi:hydroxymethylbilane synthase